MIRDYLENAISETASQLYPEWQGRAVVEEPRDSSFGDYASSIAMVLSRQVKQAPRVIAEAIVSALKEHEDFERKIVGISIDGPGFINIRLAEGTLWDEVGLYVKGGIVGGKTAKDKTVMVEFSSPNIAKPFNVGHLRSTIIGDSLARMYSYLGYTVLKDNHLGDWGTQYGKLAYAVDAWGDWSKIEADPIPELFALYVRFHQEEVDNKELSDKGREYFKRLEQKDAEVVSTWEKLVALSIKDFSELYQQLGVAFDMQLGESFYEPMLAEVIEECKERGIARQSEGAWLIFFDDDPELKDAPLMIAKSNGTSTYGTRDLAGIKYRFSTYNLDKLIIEIGNEQRLYFMQVIAAAQKLGWVSPGQLLHVGHGLFMLPTGKMSTRKGETVWVRQLIEELGQRAAQIVADKSPELPEDERADVARMVAIGALKYNDLSQNRLSNVVFDKEKSLSLEGNSAPYLQYSVARGRKVLEAAGVRGELDTYAESLLHRSSMVDLSDHERSLLAHLGKFDSVIEQAAETYLPNVLALYLFQLSQKYSSFYQNDPILSAEDLIKNRRLVLVGLSVAVLVKGLDLLGIEAPKRM